MTDSNATAATYLSYIKDSVAELAKAERRILSDVAFARQEGVSWAIIAEGLGVSRQAAHERYASPVTDYLAEIAAKR